MPCARLVYGDDAGISGGVGDRERERELILREMGFLIVVLGLSCMGCTRDCGSVGGGRVRIDGFGFFFIDREKFHENAYKYFELL